MATDTEAPASDTPPAPVSPWAPLFALVERAGWQAIEVAVSAVLLVLVDGTLDYNAGEIAILAGIAAGLTVLANGIPALDVSLSNPNAALALRVVRSFVSAFLAPIVASTVLPTDPAAWKAAALAGAVAAFSIIKGAAAERFGAPTPATLPASLDLAA